MTNTQAATRSGDDPAMPSDPTKELAHSKLGASSMYRWSACPGSVRLSKNIPNTSSRYAAEGTVAHNLAADCLIRHVEPFKFIGIKFTVESHDFIVDDEMVEAVTVYVDYCRKLAARPGAVSMVEQRFDLSSVYKGCFGTGDFVSYWPQEKLLDSVDYKHGAGKGVEVVGNPQLDYYSLGALLKSASPVQTVRKTIVQPRYNHVDGPIRHEDIKAIDLLDFRADLVNYAKATEDPNAKLLAGDHCGFCPAAAVCPELHKKATNAAKIEFSAVTAYDPAALRLALDSIPAITAWVKATHEFAYREAEAGRPIPGYKLVAKRATRKWRSEGEAILAVEAKGIDPALAFEPRALRSPAQIEAVMGKPAFKAEMSGLVVSESSGHTLAHESDKRPAVKPNAADEFVAVPQTETKPKALTTTSLFD